VAAGIDFEPVPLGGPIYNIYVSIDHLTANSNGYGVYLNGVVAGTSYGFISGVIKNSTIDMNILGGVFAQTQNGGFVQLTIDDTSVSLTNYNNTGTGITASGISSDIWLSRVRISHNAVGVQISGGIVSTALNSDFSVNLNDVSGGTLTTKTEQ
jgi:hypothetical protein